MKRRVMEPFRAPRSVGKAMKRHVIKETQPNEVSPAKAKGVGKVVSAKASSEPRRSPRRTGKQDTEDVYPQPVLQTVHHKESDSEEPTEFGLVWERFVIEERGDKPGGDPNERLEVTTRSTDTVGVRVSNAEDKAPAPLFGSEPLSPCLSEYESEGFLSRRRAISKLAKAKKGHFERAKTVKEDSSESSDDDVPVATLLQRKVREFSDCEDDNLPIAAAVVASKLNALAEVSAGSSSPLGEKCIGIEVARDFGPPHGVCEGKIVSVDVKRRRPLYHVLYGDGDEEDYDEGELQYARELFVAHKLVVCCTP
jgi:hypothetical protein